MIPVASQAHLDAAVQLVESGAGGETASLTSSKSEGGSQVRGLRLVLLAPDEDAVDTAAISPANSPTSSTSTASPPTTTSGQPFPKVSHAYTLSGLSSDSGLALAPVAVASSAKSSAKCPSGRSTLSSMSGLSGDSGTAAASLARLELRGDRYASFNYLFVQPPTIGPSEVECNRTLLEMPGGSFPRAHPPPPPQPPLQGARAFSNYDYSI